MNGQGSERSGPTLPGRGALLLFEFPMAAAINYHKLGSLKQHKHYLTFLKVRGPKWKLQAKIKGLTMLYFFRNKLNLKINK